MDTRSSMSAFSVIALVGIGIVHILRGSQFIIDVMISLIGIWVFLRFYERTHQDLWSYGAFLSLLILHAANLYWVSVPLTTFDHVLHVYGGFVMAIIAERMFSTQGWSWAYRASIIILVVMGANAIHEIVEFLGYLLLGEGDGFLFYGLGDEGDWFNSMRDLIADLIGATLFVLTKRMLKKYH